ncbi:MAG TPA: GNAT family N-acetyltransferase [Gammaproteobacteria bacterium]|nr:GNAT family N-acetyltransferase [Gammaproteobacteria bacterium]
MLLEHNSGEAGLFKEQSAVRILAINSIEELRSHESALDDLAKSATEANVFLESWMFFPALEAFGRRKRIVFLLFFEEDPKGSRLCGFMPLQRRTWFHGLPFPTLALWNYPHSFLATPLLRKGYAGEVVDAFFAWVKNRRRGALLLELPRISCIGDLHISLERTLQQDRLVTADSRYERALFRPRESAELYFEEALSKKRRKEFRRLERQLSGIGTLAVDRMDAGADPAVWIEEFLRLELAGWKGRKGTAFAAQNENRTFFRKIAEAAALRGRLEMLALRLDGRAIAMKCNLLAKNGGFAFKIAYDEQFHQYSPGVLLELAQIRWLHADPARQWMDSCADPGHFMINRLWLDRRPLRTLVVSTGHPFGNAAVRIVRFLKFIYRFRNRSRPEHGKRDYKSVFPLSTQ